MATLLTNNQTISTLLAQKARLGLKVRHTHYQTSAGNRIVVSSPINCDWLRFNGKAAILDQADDLPYDHTGDAYLGTTSIRSAHNPYPVTLTKPRHTYRKYNVTCGFEIVDPKVLHEFFLSTQKPYVIGGEDMEKFRATKK